MCRLYGLRANEPTKVECSLVLSQNGLLAQSRADRRGESHPDGWGMAFYENGEPEVQRRTTAAYDCVHFSVTAERVYARTVVAHVRQATVGAPSLVNTHPFTHRQWVFAHNGTIRAFDKTGPLMVAETDPALLEFRRGSTDSELAFYWLLTRLANAGVDLNAPCTDTALMVDVLREAVRCLDARCRQAGAASPAKLNFLLTDGTVLMASRCRNTLYWHAREGIHDCELCGIPHVHHTRRVDYRAVVVASEPVSPEPWDEVPEGSILAVDGEVGAEIHSL